MKSPQGFTLLELLTAMAVLAILVAIGVPSFRNMISSNRMTAAANGFATALAEARSEAIKQNRRVRICRRNLTPANGACGSGAGWESGWLIHRALDDNTFAPTNTATHIRIGGGVAGTITVRGNANVDDDLVYTAQGLSPGSNGQITVCDSARPSDARYIVIANTGRVTVQKQPSIATTAPSCPP